MLNRLLILLLLFSGTVSAQKVWTLEECIAHAREHNIQIRQNELNAELSDADYKQSIAAYLPTLNGTLFGGYNFGQRLDQFNLTFVNQRTTSFNMNLQGNLLLFSGLQNLFRIKQTKYALESSRYNVKQTEYDVSLNIANAYMQLLFAEERMTISERQLDLTRKQVERVRDLESAGSATRGDLLTVEAQYTSEEINLTRATNQLNSARLALIQLLNLQDSDIKIYHPDIKPEMLGSDVMNSGALSIYQYAVSRQPGILGAESRVKSLESTVKLSKAAFSPSLNMIGSIGTGYSSLSQRITDTIFTVVPQPPTIVPTYAGDTVAIPNSPLVGVNFTRQTTPMHLQFRNNYNAQIGIALSIPILNGLQNHITLKRSRINLQNAKLDLESRRLNLRNTIQTAWNDASAAFKSYEASKKNTEALLEVYQYAEERFAAGTMNSLDFNNAKIRYNNSELETLISKYEYLFRVKVLEFYMDKPLKL